MFILITIAIIVPSALFAWAVLSRIKKLKNNSAMHYPAGCLISALIPLFSLNLTTILISASEYDGNCYGLTDSISSCTFTEFITTQLTLGYLIFAPILIVSLIGVTSAFGIAWNRYRKETTEEKASTP